MFGFEPLFSDVIIRVVSRSLSLTHTDPHLPWLSARDWGIVTGSILVTTALEAYTWQIDNLILAAFQYAILVTFLT